MRFYCTFRFEKVYISFCGLYKTIIKNIVLEKGLGNKNIREKNNLNVFENMTVDEWQEVVEEELLDFLSLLK